MRIYRDSIFVNLERNSTVSGTVSIFESCPVMTRKKKISNRGIQIDLFLHHRFEFSTLRAGNPSLSLFSRLFLSILRMTSVFPEVYATTIARHPLPKDGEFERGVFNRRSTATVESRSRREPPNNWHTLPRDWQLPPVPPRSCNPRHARIHGPRRRTGNRRGRSSDASCPSSTATPIPCALSSIRVLAEACESSSLSLLSPPNLALLRYFSLLSTLRVPFPSLENKQKRSLAVLSSPPRTNAVCSCFDVPLPEIGEFHYLKDKIQSQ